MDKGEGEIKERSMFIYEIGGKKYIQRKLVIGQWAQLTDILEGFIISEDVDVLGLLKGLKENGKLYFALACILRDENNNIPWLKINKTENGKPIIEADNDAFAAFALDIACNTDDIVIKIANDFFDFNPIISLLERLTGLAKKITKQIEEAKIGSKKSSASSQEETSQKETASSGDIPLESASLT